MSGARRRFRFIKEIAEGGFGKVYLAEQISQDGFSRIVAIKLLHAKWSSHDEVVMRTRDEARLLGLIRHQHIVKVEDLTSIDGKCAIVMEYLEGCDLKWMVQHLSDKGEHFPRAALFEIILATTSALDAAYNGEPLQGGSPLQVIHRDIKPSNIFVTVSGSIKVLDFGTARANFAEREAKTQALAFGSQGYMAPERMLGEEDTPAADIFSLGVSLYELLTLESFGRIPPRPNKFQAKVEEKVASLPLDGDPEWCDQVRETLRLMLSYEPSERPTAAQLVDIFELLSQNANDMGLRRFCRVLVAEAKAAEPDLETGDPLAGQTMEEDLSSAFGVGVGGMPVAPAVDSTAQAAFGSAPPPPPDSGGNLGAAPPPPGAPPAASPPAPAADELPTTVAKAPSVPPAANPASLPPADAESGGGGGGGLLKFAIAGFVGLLVLGGVLLLGGLAIALVMMGPPDFGGAAPAVDSVESEAPAPEEEAATEEPAASEPVFEVTSKDERTDVKRTKTVLKMAHEGGGEVTISSGFGYKAEWNGIGEFDAGELAEGAYRTNVTPAGGKKIRSKSFDVKPGMALCEFTFSVDAQAWEGGCSEP